MSEAFHRAITGQALSRGELLAGGVLVIVWFLMDCAQWIDWLSSKIAPSAVVCIR